MTMSHLYLSGCVTNYTTAKYMLNVSQLKAMLLLFTLLVLCKLWLLEWLCQQQIPFKKYILPTLVSMFSYVDSNGLTKKFLCHQPPLFIWFLHFSCCFSTLACFSLFHPHSIKLTLYSDDAILLNYMPYIHCLYYGVYFADIFLLVLSLYFNIQEN